MITAHTWWRPLLRARRSPAHAAGARGPAPGAAAVQRRWWFDVDATRKNYDKPAVTGSKYAYIKQHVPCVMLQTVRGLGKKGQIVHVKRGYARHYLVPKSLAVFGTWENIDAYADPELVEDPTLRGRVAAERGRLPFDWVDDIRLRFVRWARDDHLSTLLDPITPWDVLAELSSGHELDLLPGNLDMPDGGISRIGVHDVPVRIPFRSAESAAGRYTILVDVVSQQSLQDELRREEMARAVAESMRFSLPQRGGAVQEAEGFDEVDEDEESDISFEAADAKSP